MEEQPKNKKELPEFTGEIPDEARFHQERFNKMAERYERSLAQKFLNWNAKMSAKDFAQIEAIRDDADFEKRQSEEFQRWERKLRVVIDRLFEKKNDPERKDIRSVLLIMGGGMKGAAGAGQSLIGLPAVGMDKVFDAVVGVSAGAAEAAYLVAGGEQVPKGASIFYEECAAGEFIKRSRINQVVNIDVVTEAMSRGEKAVDQQAVLGSKTEFYVGVTRESDGECELIDAKTAKPGMIAAIGASMALPIAYRKAITVNGEKYVDGVFDPMPIQKIIERFNPTDILVLPNIPFKRTDAFELSAGEYMLAEFADRVGLSNAARFLRVNEEIRKSLQVIQNEQKVNIGILWPPDSDLGNLTTDSKQVEAAVIESARGVIKAFGAEQPGALPLFHAGTRN